MYQKLNGKIWQQIYQNVPNNNQLFFFSNASIKSPGISISQGAVQTGDNGRERNINGAS